MNDESGRATDGALTGARTESVDALRAHVDDLRAEVALLREAVLAAADWAEAFGAVVERVERLAEQVGRAEDGDGQSKAMAWVDADGERAPAILAELTGWIAGVLVHYPQVTDLLYGCWYRHPPLVQVLMDAHAAWLGAYRRPGQRGPSAALAWQERCVPLTVDALRVNLARCSSIEHSPTRRPVIEAFGEPMWRYAHWWAVSRDPATEPVVPLRRPAATHSPDAAPAPGVQGWPQGADQ